MIRGVLALMERESAPPASDQDVVRMLGRGAGAVTHRGEGAARAGPVLHTSAPTGARDHRGGQADDSLMVRPSACSARGDPPDRPCQPGDRSAWSRVCQRRSVVRTVPRGTAGGRVERGDSLPEHGRRRAFPRFPLVDDGLVRRAHQCGQLRLAQPARATQRTNLQVVVVRHIGPRQWLATIGWANRPPIVRPPKRRGIGGSRAGPGAVERLSGCHKSPAGARPVPPLAAS